MRDTVLRGHAILQFVRKTPDGGAGRASHARRCRDGKACSPGIGWPRRTKLKYCGGAVAGERSIAAARSRRADDISQTRISIRMGLDGAGEMAVRRRVWMESAAVWRAALSRRFYCGMWRGVPAAGLGLAGTAAVG